jgi:stage V sporulation protein B
LQAKSESFMRGAFLITAAAFVARLLGAVYRPVAQHFLGDQGLALVSPPANAYLIILAVSSSGLNVAISRMVSERLALADYRGARRLMRVATALLLLSGLLFAGLFALASPYLAAKQGVPEATPGFLILAPAIFMVTLVVAFRGLYQGMQQMRHAALSQVVDQGARVGGGLLLVALLAPHALNLGAAGFNAGATAGVTISALYGAWVFFKERPLDPWALADPVPDSLETVSLREILGRFLAIAIPISLVGAVQPLMGQIDSWYTIPRLLATGISSIDAREALAHIVNAQTLRDLPSILSIALYTSLVPALAESMATRSLDQAKRRVEASFRITFLVGLPATIGLVFGARAAYGVFFTGAGYEVLAPLGWSTLFLMVQQISSGVLQGMGLIWISVCNLLVGVLLKVLLTYWWLGIPSLGVDGAAYAWVVAYGAIVVLNLLVLRSRLQIRVRVRRDLLPPLLASVMMGLVIWLVESPIMNRIHSHRLSGLVVIAVGGAAYVLFSLALGGVREPDLRMIPGMRPAWVEWLKRHHLVRA